MKRKKIIYLCVVLFIGINICLIAFDKEENVERKSYVTDWAKTFKADMYEKIDKPGVLAAIEENDIYFNDNMGSFQGFLVDEGTQVNVGDELYTYQVQDYFATKAQLESEIDKINGEISAIEQAISTISFYQVPRINVSLGNEDDSEETTIPSVEADYMKKQYLTQKENELAQKNAQLESVQTQLTELQMSGDTITVESPYQGNITMVSESLADPLITIESTQLYVKGELTEKERMEMEQGMPVEVAVSENDTVLQGTINKISDSPKTVDISGKSIYPFAVSFADEAEQEELLPGFHANMAITMDESTGATVAHDDVIFGNSIWKMTSEGKLSKQKIKKGIHSNQRQEITEGANFGDLVAEDHKSQFRSGATFITPLKLDEVRWKQLFDADEFWKSFVTGLLSR
ncbi:efflux RND transporter periplasmic adaptor subunit [Lentibacillus sp. Marseille-P4043]|uniref:efflux RND transporter periplasmic adaptor subunit n=1 Tax=Lentibacillus sp. Marseille-P4043 TaxID=2040293 RepID=UPI000D0B3CFC|nr:HlyD family efflux transporter periplasmic adaptor subunit [Lentibacillus sp. Marseille-P4043]